MKYKYRKSQKYKPAPQFIVFAAYWWNPIFWLILIVAGPIIGLWHFFVTSLKWYAEAWNNVTNNWDLK